MKLVVALIQKVCSGEEHRGVPDDAGLGHTGLVLDAKLGEAISDVGRGFTLLEAELRMPVEVAPVDHNLVLEAGDRIMDGWREDGYGHVRIS